MTQNGHTDSWTLPPLGQNPSTTAQGTTPGSFAKPPAIAPGPAGRWTFASPDTPGMPQPSEKTAWDFLPEVWESSVQSPVSSVNGGEETLDTQHSTLDCVEFTQRDGSTRTVTYPSTFTPVTQLEHARLGIITPEMQRVAERESHL